MPPEPIDGLAVTATDVGPVAPSAPEGLTHVGRYRLERQLGAGGMGVVYAAHDPDLDRRVALKVLRVVGDDARARLLREARAMAKLMHPNVVTVFEVGTADDRDYIAMELVDGASLADWWAAGEHSVRDRVDAVLAAGRGLAAAHAAGIVHRDFKPHNVLRAHDGRILVTDFGLARTETMIEGSADGGASTTGRTSLVELTRTGAFVGTPAYMSPEQWAGGAITAATDQFAFCVSLWEAITRKRPFSGSTLEELRAEVERGPSGLDARELPRSMQAILLRGLARDPAQRWPDMNTLLGQVARTRQSRRWLPPLLVGTGVVAIAITALVATRSPAHERDGAPHFTKMADGHVTASRPAIDHLIADLRARKGAKFVPTVGPTTGFKLYAIQPASYLDAIGVLNGDVLVAIDGQAVDTSAHLDQVVGGVASKGGPLRLDLSRRGALVTLTIDVR